MCALQLRARSEDDADDELLSVAVVKNGNKAVTGSQTGVLSLYSWGYFSDCSDRFPGDPLFNIRDSSMTRLPAFVARLTLLALLLSCSSHRPTPSAWLGA